MGRGDRCWEGEKNWVYLHRWPCTQKILKSTKKKPHHHQTKPYYLVNLSEFSKPVRYRINVQISIAFLYTSNKQLKNKIITIYNNFLKITKYLRNREYQNMPSHYMPLWHKYYFDWKQLKNSRCRKSMPSPNLLPKSRAWISLCEVFPPALSCTRKRKILNHWRWLLPLVMAPT